MIERLTTKSADQLPAKTKKVLNFWFNADNEEYWFAKNDAFDTKINDRFGDTLLAAKTGECADWRSSVKRALALKFVTIASYFLSRDKLRLIPLVYPVFVYSFQDNSRKIITNNIITQRNKPADALALYLVKDSSLTAQRGLIESIMATIDGGINLAPLLTQNKRVLIY